MVISISKYYYSYIRKLDKVHFIRIKHVYLFNMCNHEYNVVLSKDIVIFIPLTFVGQI